MLSSTRKQKIPIPILAELKECFTCNAYGILRSHLTCCLLQSGETSEWSKMLNKKPG